MLRVKNLKKLITLIVILIIFIIIIVLLLLKLRNQDYAYDDPRDGEPEESEMVKNITPTPVTNPTMYYTAVECINKYLQYCSTRIPTGETREALEEASLTDEDRRIRIYNELSTEYIQENNITIENVRGYVHTAEYHLSFYPISMNMLTSKSNSQISSYGAYGRLKDSNTGDFIGYTYITVIFDLNNTTFAIELNSNNNIESIEDLTLETNIVSIDKNDNNVFSYEAVNEQNLVKRYISTYKMYALYNPEIAYEYLNEEYKNKRFGTLDNYKQYVEQNRDAILKISLDKYQKTKKDGYTQYVCIDTEGNYYIIKETATMQFGLILDTYTLDLPEFTEKYENADDTTKVGMNIEKIKEALNSGDYEYVYNKFTDGFKNNYFKTVEDFKNYVQQNWYKTIKITYNSISTEGKAHVFEVYLSDETGENSNVITKNFNIQLQEGTDFIFSFNV